MENEAKILLVDDDDDILNMLQFVFKKEGFQRITTCSTGTGALEEVNRTEYDLIVLDVMLPDKTGFEIIPFIREKTDCPIFFLTARTSDFDKLSGFAYGADDYITKPFHSLEVIARARAILRRRFLQLKPKKEQTIYDFGLFQVHTGTGELIVNGRAIDCSAQVFQLLVYFCQNPNQILTKQQIYEKVWGYYGKLVDDNTISVHIHKIRERIEQDPKNPRYLKTVRGLGYRLVKDK